MDQSLPSPRTTPGARSGRRIPGSRRTWLLAAIAAVIAAILAFIGVYVALFSGSSAKPLQLSSGSTSNAQVAANTVTGTWSITSGSVVGYRVREKLAMLPAQSDAVGRTSRVAGTIAVATHGNNVQVTTASFVANMRSLKSDRSMRDERIHTIGLESDQYPTAGFKLTRPVTLPATAFIGQTIHVSATGRLTIHGTTRTVTIPLTGRLQGGQIEVAGSLTFPFTKFGMQPPNIAGFVSVENHATMEFDLTFKHGTSAGNDAAYRAINSLQPISGQSGQSPPPTP